MPTLIIRDVPATLHRQLKEQADRNHRSASREALSVLEERLSPAQPRWDLLKGLQRPKLGKGPDLTQVIRSIRDAA